MNKTDRLLIGALVLGVWALVAMQFFQGAIVNAAPAQRGELESNPLYVEVIGEVEINDSFGVEVTDHLFGLDVEVKNWPASLNVYCTNCN